MFPGDFDGIVAGSPALDFNNLASWRASFLPITGSVNSANFITASKWTNLIHNEILRQCDGLDGAIDGIIEDPGLCNFIPETLMCTENTATECLTSVQVEMIRKVFSPLYGENGKLIYPAMQPGSEGMAVNKLYAGKPFSYSEVLDLPNLFSSLVNAKDIRTGSDSLSMITPRGILPRSQSTTPPQLKRLIHRISGPGQVTSPRFAMHPAKSSATMVVKITKSQASIPSVSTITFQVAWKFPQ